MFNPLHLCPGSVIVLRPLQHRSNKEEQFTEPFAGFKNFFGSMEVYLNSESGIPVLFHSLSLSLLFSQFRMIQLVPTLATFALNRANETSRNFYHLSYPTRASLPNNEVNLSADQRIPLFFFLFVKRQSAKGSILAVKTFINAASNVFRISREGTRCG